MHSRAYVAAIDIPSTLMLHIGCLLLTVQKRYFHVWSDGLHHSLQVDLHVVTYYGTERRVDAQMLQILVPSKD